MKALVLGAAFTLSSFNAVAEEVLPEVTVYKSPSCGCCTAWVKHMEENGFKVTSHNVQDVTRYKNAAGVPGNARSCHTAFVGDYAVEGHVPAEDVLKLLEDRPADVKGLAVPGMPMGSPGMDFGPQKDEYKVISFTKDGKTSVYAQH
ncbi:metal-binding protein [Endozoicomonas sp. OPT23]|nr:metal-binding protein [Endozoicomonas sp. OPT23]